MDEPSGDHLVRSFAAGDGAAFERLYGRHQAALYRFVRRLLGRHAATQADEVFQDTWLRAIQARHDWAPQGASFRTWLFTLAHHRAVDCLRKCGREVSDMTNDPVLSLPIPLRLLLAAQPKPVTFVLQVVHRVITRHLPGQAGLKPDEADSGAVTPIQRFGSGIDGLTLHASVRCGADDRQALEQLCRYFTRPPCRPRPATGPARPARGLTMPIHHRSAGPARRAAGVGCVQVIAGPMEAAPHLGGVTHRRRQRKTLFGWPSTPNRSQPASKDRFKRLGRCVPPLCCRVRGAVGKEKGAFERHFLSTPRPAKSAVLDAEQAAAQRCRCMASSSLRLPPSRRPRGPIGPAPAPRVTPT
jgi:RNA polymerase sigma factor (sigma-70 family)